METIKNKDISICVKALGAELCSLKGRDGTEYIWQADPAVWPRHSPVLFPIIGKLRNGQYQLNGKTYTLMKHGFAREMNFKLIEKHSDALVYQLISNEKTRIEYPFEFEMNISYRLNGKSLETSYEIKNNGVEVMPFSIGAHPGFNLPAPLEACYLEFEKKQTLNAHLLGKEGLLSNETLCAVDHSSRLLLTKNLFDRDALIFLGGELNRVRICSTDKPVYLRVDFYGFPQLGLWSKPAAPYLCIEPWYGYDDPEEPYGDVMHKPGIQKLAAGHSFNCRYQIHIEQ